MNTLVLEAGIYWKKASEIGAIAALFGGLIALIGLEPIRKSFSITLAPEQIGLLSLFFTSILMILGSLVFPDNKREA